MTPGDEKKSVATYDWDMNMKSWDRKMDWFGDWKFLILGKSMDIIVVSSPKLENGALRQPWNDTKKGNPG